MAAQASTPRSQEEDEDEPTPMKTPVSGIIAGWSRSSRRIDVFVRREFRALARIKEQHGSVPTSMLEQLIATFGLTNAHGRPASARNVRAALLRVEGRMEAATAVRRVRAERTAGWRDLVEATGAPVLPAPPAPAPVLGTTGPPVPGTAEDMIEAVFENFRAGQPQMPTVPDRKVTP